MRWLSVSLLHPYFYELVDLKLHIYILFVSITILHIFGAFPCPERLTMHINTGFAINVVNNIDIFFPN